MSDMTRAEAIAIIRKEYLCVDRDCDIERSCGKCDLMMPSKEPILEAYKIAINSLKVDEMYDLAEENADEFISKSHIKSLGEEMRITQKSITDEKVLLGFNMAVALCNKHLGEKR